MIALAECSCIGMMFLLVLLGAAIAMTLSWRSAQKPTIKDERAIVDALRAKLLTSPTLQHNHPDACEILRHWDFSPSRESASTDREKKLIHLRVVDKYSTPYDAATLLIVLLHEVAHAAEEEGHGPAWEQRNEALVRAAVDDGILEIWEEVDPRYPAQILG